MVFEVKDGNINFIILVIYVSNIEVIFVLYLGFGGCWVLSV